MDDDENLLEIVKVFLEETKYITVNTAISAQDAQVKLASTQYDAVVSDYDMPKMNGIEFLKYVRRTYGDLPFILFTGKGREEVVIQAINNGADFYLQKGGEPESQFAELSHKVRQAVQRRKAEARNRNYERREADILNFLPDATFAIDTDCRVIAWNRAMEKMTGIAASEILGKGNYEYALPFYRERRPILIDLVLTDDPAAAARYPNIKRTGKNLFSEITIPHFHHGGGASLWFTASPLYNTGGDIIGAIESIRDITDRKRSEEELHAAYEQLSAAGQQLKSQVDELVQKERRARQSDERFRQIVENAGEWIWEIDTAGLFTYSSPVVEKILGYKPDELIGRMHFFDLFVPEEREVMTTRAFDAFANAMSFKGIQNPFLHKEGTRVFLETSCVPILDEQGNIAGYRGVDTDITEYKRQEQILRFQLDLGLRLQSVRGMGNALEICLNAAFEIAGMETGGIYLVDEKTGSVDLALSKNLGDVFVRSVSHYPAGSVNAKMVMAGKPLYTLNSQEGVALSSVDEKEGLQVCAVIPIISGGRVIACMNVASHTLDEIPPAARVALETIATQIGTALEKIRSDEALIRSEQKYRNVVEDQTEFISRFLPDGTHIFVNDAYCRYFNKTRKELIGRRFIPVIPFEDQQIVRDHFRALTPSNPVDTVIHRVILPDGSVRWHRWSDRAIFDEHGLLTEYQSVGRDMTDIKHAEETLRQKESVLRSMLDATPVGVVLLANRVLQKVNRSLCKITGYSEEEMIGQSTRMLFPDNEEFLRTGRELYGQIEKEGLSTVETLFRRKNGEIINVLMSVSQFDPDNLSAGVTGTVMDITDRKRADEAIRQSEKNYRNVVENSQDSFYQSDKKGNLILANLSFARSLGYETVDELYGKNIAETVWFRPELREKFLEEISKRGFVTNYPITLKKRDGTPVFVEVNSHIYHEDPGWAGGIEGTIRDVTERRATEEALRRVNRQLNLLTSITRHDMLNKIMTMLSYLVVAKKKFQNPEIQAFIEKMESVTKAMKSQIEFTRVYQDLGTHEPQWQDAGRILSSMEIPSAITLQSHLQGVEIFADPLLGKVFYNLLDNTVRHGRNATLIGISYRQAPSGLVLIWEDNGMGVPDADKNQIFERGFGKNNGLGLFLVREILAITDMTIKENGTEGQGARFEILVPEGKYRNLTSQ